MRTEAEIEGLTAGVDQRIKRLESEERRLKRDRRARAKLARVGVQLHLVDARSSRVALRQEALRAKAIRLQDEIADALAADGAATDGSPATEEQRKLMGELAAVEANAVDRSWGVQLEALRRRKLALETERQRIAAECEADLISELHAEGEQLHAELVEAVGTIYPLRDRWAALANAYREFEAARGGPRVTGRLDLPPFPVEIGPLPEPVPTAFAENDDPTIREEVTA
jgi:hypothetical protein